MSKKSIKLSDLQISVMKVLWQNKKLSVSETHRILNKTKPLALTTVATLLKRMVEKGTVNYEKVGRQHLYYPIVSESEIKTSMLSSMMAHFFNGKPTEMINHLVDQEDMSEKELQLIRELLEKGTNNSKELNND